MDVSPRLLTRVRRQVVFPTDDEEFFGSGEDGERHDGSGFGSYESMLGLLYFRLLFVIIAR